MNTKQSDRKLTRMEAALYVGSTSGTLSVWASKKRHLNPFKIGRNVYYWQSDLDQYLDRKQKTQR